MANDLPQGITESPIQSSAPLPAIEKPLGNGTTDVGTDLQQNQSSALAAGYPVHTPSGVIQPKTPPPALPPGITESPLPPAGITESPIAQGAAKTAGQAVQPPTSDADRDLMSTVTGFEGGPPAQSLDEQFQISKKAGRFLDAWQRGLTVTPVTGFEKDVPTEVPSREQFAKEHPYASGIAETLGEKVGGLVASPEYWPILAMPFGSAAPFLIKLAIQAGFTTAMAQSVFSQASQAGADWDQLSQQEKVKRVTSMSVDGAMAGFAAKEAGETTLKGGVGAVKSAAAAVKGAVRPGEVEIAGKTAPVSAPQAGKPVAQVLEKFTTPGSAEEYQRTQTMPKAKEQAVSTVGQPMKDRIEAHKAIANGEPAPDKIAGTSTPAPYNTFDDIVKDAKAAVQPMWDKADAHDVEVKAKYDADVAQQKQAIADHNKKVDEYNAGLGKDETPMDRAKFDPDQVEKPQILSELRSALQQAKANGASADPAIRAKAWETDVPKAEKDIDTWFKQNSDVVSPAEYESGKDLWRHAERVQDIANGLRGSMAKGTMTGNTLRGIEASMDNKAIRRQGPSGVGTFKRLLGDDGYENWQNVARLFDPVGGKSSVMRSAGTYALEMLAAHLFGPAGIGVKLGSELLLNRILFDKTWGGWFSRAASFVKSTPAGVAPVIPNDLVQEGADHLKTEMPAQTKLSQRPATEMTPQQIQQLKAVGMTDEDIASLNKIRATRTTAPAIGEGVGGHAGGGTVSAEELARGKNWMVDKGGNVTYDGNVHRPEETPQGGAHVTEKPDGTLETNEGTLTPQMEEKLRAAITERDTGRPNVTFQPKGSETTTASGKFVLGGNISDDISKIVTDSGRSAYDVNDGSCRDVACAIAKAHPDASVHVGITHTYIEQGGKFYDAETPQGVSSPKDLPIFEGSAKEVAADEPKKMSSGDFLAKYGKTFNEFQPKGPETPKWETNLPADQEFPGKELGSHLSKTQMVPIEQIVPSEKSNPEQVAKLVEQFRKDPSQIPPIVAEFSHDGEHGEDMVSTVDGHNRLEAARQLGIKEIPTQMHVSSDDWAKVKSAGGMTVNRPTEGTPKLSQKAGVARARAKVTNTPEFKNWFGDSKVVDEKGQPKVVYHGTTHTFNTFEPERGNVEGQYGKGIYFTDSPVDMSHNYAGEGPDLTGRIERRADQIANEENLESPKYGTPEYRKFYDDLRARAKAEIAGEHGGQGMPMHLKMENPIEMSQRGKGTNFEINYDEDSGKESGSGMKLFQALHNMKRRWGAFDLDPQEVWGKVMENITDPTDFSAWQFDNALDKVLGAPYDITDNETGAWAIGEFKRQLYQQAGFDGVVTTASDDFPSMKNIPAGTKHYIAFEPTQAKSAMGNTGAFDPNNPDIRLSQEGVSLEDWDKFREAPAPLEHPITHDMLKDAFHGQDVQQVDPRNYVVKLDNGSDLHINLVDSITGPSVEMQLQPGNVALGSFQKIGDGGIMQLAGISGEATLGHETAHAGLGLLPKRLQDAVLEKFQGDEEKFADWYGDNRKTLDRGGEPDSLFGQIKNYFQDLYEKVFKPAQYAMRQIQEGRVWDRANEKFVESADLRPALSQKTYPAWEKSFRKAAAEQGATPDEIERHIKEVAPAYGLFKGLTDVPPDLKGSNLFDNAWEGKKTTFEYQGFCPKNKNYNPTKAAIEQQIGRFLNKQETIGLTLLMHSEALDAPCNYCYTLSGSAAVSENLGNTARNGVWVGGENIPETDLKLQTRPHPDKPGATQTFIPPVEERLLTDSDYREKMIAKDPELADKVKLQQWYGDKKVYGNLKAHKPTEEGIIPARGALLRKSPEEIAQVNSKRGYRVSGNVDVTPYSYMDVAQDLADARLMGAKRYSYTKQPDYVRLVGNTGEKINMSLTMDPRSTDFIRNDWSDSMDFDEAKALRKQFPNAGTMLMTLNDNHILAGLKNPDVDMMIPYHGTRGKFPAAVKEFVQDYSRENHETDMKTGDTISGDKEIKQTEHNGDLQTYLRICKERGYLPKFARFIYDNVTFNKSENGVSSVRIKTDPETGEPEPPKIRKDTSKNYMKLVKDISRTDSPHVPIQRNVDMDHLNSVVSQIKAGNMPWSGQAHPGVTKMAVDRIKAGKPLYNGEMGYSYTPKAEVPLVQIQPAKKK